MEMHLLKKLRISVLIGPAAVVIFFLRELDKFILTIWKRNVSPRKL